MNWGWLRETKICGPRRQGLIAPHHRLGPAQVDGDVAELVALDDAVDDLASAVLVFAELALALGLADFLYDHLLGGLGRDASQIDGRQLLDDKLARRDARLARLAFAHRNLRDLVLDLVGHLAIAPQADFAGLAVNHGADVVLVAVFGAAGL
jgi:hypothetical protein